MNHPYRTPAPEPPTWAQRAACRNQPAAHHDWWFPEHGETHLANRAKAICGSCPVRTDCLDYALANNERHGIWGAYSFGKPVPRQQARQSRAAG